MYKKMFLMLFLTSIVLVEASPISLLCVRRTYPVITAIAVRSLMTTRVMYARNSSLAVVNESVETSSGSEKKVTQENKNKKDSKKTKKQSNGRSDNNIVIMEERQGAPVVIVHDDHGGYDFPSTYNLHRYPTARTQEEIKKNTEPEYSSDESELSDTAGVGADSAKDLSDDTLAHASEESASIIGSVVESVGSAVSGIAEIFD